jgi:putative exosortase-associated protein (TIGR04073 family)
MRKLLFAAVAALLVLSFAGRSPAYETDFDDLQRFDRNLPSWKFGRGVSNIVGGPAELFTSVTNNALEGAYYGAYDEGVQGAVAGSFNGFVAGIFPGFVNALRRMTTGGLEMLTFWKPEYGPTLDPTWQTRCRAWPDQDFFNPEPFWYWGPDR